ncbi:MAG: HAD family hydrolase [Sporichthyaceae bacterium]
MPERSRAGAPRAAAFFDLDKTVIAKSSALAFSKPFYRGGLISRRAVLRSAYAQFVYLAGGADADQIERMRKYLSSLCAGWDVATVREIIAETLHDLIDPFIYDEAAQLIEEHRLAGRDVVLVSTSGLEVVEPIGEMLGVDRVIATRMEIDADGRYTGEIEFYAYAEAKAEAIAELAATDNLDLSGSYAYSDSSTDIPMLSAVGHGYAVNPDRALRREALARGWPVLSFNHPVSMRRRMPSISKPSTTVVAATAVAAAAIGAATVWWLSSRRASA